METRLVSGFPITGSCLLFYFAGNPNPFTFYHGGLVSVGIALEHKR